jgi:uncharacterized membrane protein HdeD (DUF308 family)
MKGPKNLAAILLGLWLILFGLLTQQFRHFAFAQSHNVLAVLAIVAGILYLVRRQ